jgi:hypothetical protein
VLDLSNGNEAGRVSLPEPASRAWTQGGGIYFGESSAVRFDAHIEYASRGHASHVRLPARAFPDSPTWMRSGNETTSPIADARDRVRIYAQLGPIEERIAIDEGRFYATDFKLIMGFEGREGTLAWIRVHDAEAIGGAAAHGGLAICDVDGKVTFFDGENGAVTRELDLGEPIRSCVVQIDYLHAPRARAPKESLAAELEIALRHAEKELGGADPILVLELAKLDDSAATRALIELAVSARTEAMRLEARRLLAGRRGGAEVMIEALARHYDHLKDVLTPPPVGPIALALGALKEKRAAPLLLSHLLDPATTAVDLKDIASALIVLAGPSEIPELQRFFAMYRASAESDDVAQAVVHVAEALVKHGGQEGYSLVERAAKDQLTRPYVRERLERMR